MVLRAFSFSRKTSLEIFFRNKNSRRYLTTLKEYLLPPTEAAYRDDRIFQQDGASIYTFHACQRWFREKKVGLLAWPVKSLDLIPVEILWAILARRVCRDAKQFNHAIYFRRVIIEEWGLH